MSMDPFTLVIPTRDDPDRCRQLLDTLVADNAEARLPLRVLFLVNDTAAETTGRLQQAIAVDSYSSLHPRLLTASRNFPTVEENIRHTLGGNLDAADERFLIIGNSDQVDLRELRSALEYMDAHRLDLLLIGVINREVYKGKALRQLYATPRHLNAKNRLRFDGAHGTETFADAVTDYGPVDYLAYIGCQIYTKRFFRELCEVQATLPEPLYSIPVGTLELTTRREWSVGFYPGVVAVRIDHLQYGETSPQQPPDWWVFRSRTDRGLSRHIFLSVISNSLRLSPKAFEILVNSQVVAMMRGCPQYLFSNFLFAFVDQTSGIVRGASNDAALRFSAGELADIVNFAVRLEKVDIGLPADQHKMICAWLQHFSVIGNYRQSAPIEQLMSASIAVLSLLDMRNGKERWVAQMISSPAPQLS